MTVSGIFLRQRNNRRPLEVFELFQPQGHQSRHELLDPGARVPGGQGGSGTTQRRRSQQHGEFFYSEAVSNRLQSQVGRVLVIVLGVHLNPLKDIMLQVFHFESSSQE